MIGNIIKINKTNPPSQTLDSKHNFKNSKTKKHIKRPPKNIFKKNGGSYDKN